MNREDLENYIHNKKWVDMQLSKYEEMYERVNKLTANLTGMPKGSNQVSYQLEELIDSFSELLKLIRSDNMKCNEVIKQLDQMRDVRNREVLYKVYVEGKRLEEVASEMGYDYYYVCSLKGKGLNEFDELHKKSQDITKK